MAIAYQSSRTHWWNYYIIFKVSAKIFTDKWFLNEKKSQIIESPPQLFKCLSTFLWVILTKIETLTIVIKYKPIKSQADVILTFVSQVF